MDTIALPKNIEFEPGDGENSGKMVIQPCYPGYGITLGNSIRRVLLSSLPGAAPIGVKIEGVDHEFMALPHLKEDILEFILNLKQIRLKVFTDEIVKLNLEVHGKKDIKAGDIEKNSQVEIVNPDLVLGHITDMSGNLKAEIHVSRGMGYEMIESREIKEKLSGFIEMDSIFSPVVSVGIKIENVRVGKMTNWDKLIIDIETDGTIMPEKAFQESVNILIGQYQALLSPGSAEKAEEEPGENEEREEAEDKSKKSAAEAEDEEKQDEDEEAEDKPKKKRGRPKKEDK